MPIKLKSRNIGFYSISAHLKDQIQNQRRVLRLIQIPLFNFSFKFAFNVMFNFLVMFVFMFLVMFFHFSSIASAASNGSTASSSLTLFIDQIQMDHKRNKQLCYAFEDQTPGLPCSSAFLGLNRESQIWISSFGNNNLKYFQDVADIIKGPIDTDLLLEIINHNSNEHFAASLSFGYLTENWGINIIPAKLILFTHIRNPALPRITLFASKESEVQFQLGSFFNSEWSWGIQTRFVQRSFTYNDSYFSDHFAEGSNEIYQVKKHHAFYFEPSLLYAPEDTNLNPIFSVVIDNLAIENSTLESEKLNPFNSDPKLRLGSSISTQLEPGLLQFGITTHWIKHPDNQTNGKFFSSIGVNYNVSIFQLFSTLGEIEQQLGLALNYKKLSTALSYSRQDWANNQFSEYYNLWRWELSLKF